MKLHRVLISGLILAGCGPGGGAPVAREVGDTLSVTILADSAATGDLPPARLGPGRAEALLTLVRIAPARADVRAPLPDPEPASPVADDPGPRGEAPDDGLKPPIPRGPAIVRLRATRSGWLELDVRVDETGEVTDAIPVGGDADSATVRAATDAAFGMRWFPAVRRGRPVAVWCRQRFETGPSR